MNDKMNESPRSPIKRLYRWFLAWAEKPGAEKALAGFSFAESSFFPLPPDPLLMALVFAKSNKFIRYATITTVASILGGMLGYLIGVGLFESVGTWLIDTYHLQEEYLDLGARFQRNDFIAVLTAALTPIPYKIITISAGAFSINFVSFVLASTVGRASRFFAVATLAKYLGSKQRENIERYIDVISITLIALLAILLIIF